jgi:hypothetical protein
VHSTTVASLTPTASPVPAGPLHSPSAPRTDRSADLASSWGVSKRCIDRHSARFASSEAVAAGMPLSLRQRPVRALPEFLARFEISRRNDAAAGIHARSRRPGNRVRHCLHERRRSSRGPPDPPPPLRPPPHRTLLPRRPPPLGGGLRAPRPPSRPRPRQHLRLPPPRAPHVEGDGPLPDGRFPSPPEVPGGGGAHSRRPPLLDHRHRTGPGDDRGEPRGRPSPVLRSFPAGGEAGCGGDHAFGVDSEANGGFHGRRFSRRRPAGRRRCPKFYRRTGSAGFRRTAGRQRSVAPGDTARIRECADHRGPPEREGEPHAHHGVEGVPGIAEEGEGGSVPRPARSVRRGGPHGGAGGAHREAGEAEGLRAGQGQAGSREEG